jgi:hypothetical protein
MKKEITGCNTLFRSFSFFFFLNLILIIKEKEKMKPIYPVKNSLPCFGSVLSHGFRPTPYFSSAS